jgi:hypothetical protein
MKYFDLIKKILYWFFLVLLVIANVYLFLDLQNNIFLDHYLCDGGSSDDNVHSLDGNNNDRDLSQSTSMYSKFKCRISWWLTDNQDGRYSSFSDYKTHWDPKVGFRDIIKADFNRTKADISKSNLKNRTDSENLMRDIRDSRNQSSVEKHNRFYNMFTKKR